MGIIFREDRELAASGQKVEAGKVYSFSPEEEQAFVDNQVADFEPAPDKKKAPAKAGEEG